MEGVSVFPWLPIAAWTRKQDLTMVHDNRAAACVLAESPPGPAACSGHLSGAAGAQGTSPVELSRLELELT